MPPKKKIKKKVTLAKAKKVEKSEEINTSDQSELISKKKVVFVEIDDEVTQIYDRIKPVRTKHIYLVVPKRAILFQSVVNLRILKRKAEDTGKTIYFITNDKNGVYLAQQIGIQVYNKANAEGKPALFSTEVEEDKLRITPLKATVNAVEEATPTRLKERKLSISEILRRKKRGKKSLDVSKIQSEKAKDQKKQLKKSRFALVTPNRHALIGLVSMSLIILLVIVYVALPGVTIHLVPSASVLEKSVNITLADYGKNKAELETNPTHMITSYPVETTVTKSITNFATGKKFSDRGANASGNITIYNTTSNSWPLIVDTRFQNDDGIVFRIKSPITVPASSSNGLGQIDAFVTADQKDSYGAIVGERGNIGPDTFHLPGLREGSQSKIYAKSSAPMTGGVTDFNTFIAAEDIEAAKSRLNDELLKVAVEELKKTVAKQGGMIGNGDEFTLLEGDNAVKIGDVKIDVPAGLEGQGISEFTISGSVSVSGVYYDHKEMLDILKAELTLKKSPQKELLRINEDSTSYRIFEWDPVAGKIKMTANIKGIEQFSIDPEKENGARLLKKIQEHVAGKDIEDAKNYIQNLPEINKVEIESWPAWSPTIPNIVDNIKFDVKEAISVE